MPVNSFGITFPDLDLTTAGTVLAVIPVGNMTKLSVSAEKTGGTNWNTGVVGVQWRNGTGAPRDFATVQTLRSSDPALLDLDVSSVQDVVLIVSTAESAIKITAHVWATDAQSGA